MHNENQGPYGPGKEKAMINIDRLMDLVLENNSDTYDYRKSSAAYHRTHGHGVWLNKATTPEEKHIVYTYHSSDRSHSNILAVAEVLMMDREQIERMYCAARAVSKWYQRTNWERLLPYDLKRRLESWIFGA